ncbi:MAG: hypothetical protein ABJA87_00025 [bacterium]
MCDVLLKHESAYWTTTSQQQGLRLTDAQCRQIVAVATLVGAPDAAGAEDLLTCVPALKNAGQPLAQVAVWLHDLYPAENGEWFGQLQPQMLGGRAAQQ